MNVALLSILYAMIATSFARSENTFPPPPAMPTLTASPPPPLRLSDFEDLHEIAYLKTDLTAVYQPVNSPELFGILMEADQSEDPEISD